jgi:hypothetical protein
VHIEIRVAIRNHAIQPEKYDAAIGITAADGQFHSIAERSIEVAANGQELISVYVDAAGYVGNNTIESRIRSASGIETSHSWPLQVVASTSRALPLLQFGWIDPGSINVSQATAGEPRTMSEQELRHATDRYQGLGFCGFIITYPEYVQLGHGPYYPSRVLAEHSIRAPFDVVGTILNQASKNGQRVFVGLGRGADLTLTWTGFDDAKRNQAALAHSMKMATELWTLYSHEPSFYGWYLTHEANDIARASDAYYDPLVEFLRTFQADKPVMVSPAGTPIISREILSSSKVDIFAYQDAVGAGALPDRYTYDPEVRIKLLDKMYADYAEAHRKSGKHLWANLEIWQMDGPEYANAYPARFERVKRQLYIERKHVDVVTAYEVLGYMRETKTDKTSADPASDLLKAYRSYQAATASMLKVDVDRDAD